MKKAKNKTKDEVKDMEIKEGMFFSENFDELKEMCKKGNKEFLIYIKLGKLITWNKTNRAKAK